MKINETATIVKAILENNIQARNNDNLLICLVVQQYGFMAKNRGEKQFSWDDQFYMILDLINKKKVPSLETITRCRRKVQEQYPNLRATESVQKSRHQNTEKYKNLARKGV